MGESAVAKKPRENVLRGGDPAGDDQPEKGPEKDRGRKTAPVQIDRELAKMITAIAQHDDENVSDLLSPVIRQWAITNYRRILAEGAKRLEGIDEGG